MRFRTIGAVAALALSVTSMTFVPVTLAQMPTAPSEQDHKAHHPEGAAPAQPEALPQGGMMGGQGGMMGCPMMASMMGGQGGMMGGDTQHSGMMAQHAEAAIAKLKADLKITDAQATAWNRFADALRASAKSMEAVHQKMMRPAASLPTKLAREEEMMAAHTNSLKTINEALAPLYTSLSDEQKKVADGLRIGPMGLMGMM